MSANEHSAATVRLITVTVRLDQLELKDAMRQGSNLSRRVEKTAGLDPADDGGQGD